MSKKVFIFTFLIWSLNLSANNSIQLCLSYYKSEITYKKVGYGEGITFASLKVTNSLQVSQTNEPRRTETVKVVAIEKNGSIWLFQKLHRPIGDSGRMSDLVNFVRSEDPARFSFPNGEFVHSQFNYHGGNISGTTSLSGQFMDGKGAALHGEMLRELDGDRNSWILATQYTPTENSKIKTLHDFVEKYNEFSKSIPNVDISNLELLVQSNEQSAKSLLNRKWEQWSTRPLKRNATVDLARTMGFDIRNTHLEAEKIKSRYNDLLSKSLEEHEAVLSYGGGMDRYREVDHFLKIYSDPKKDGKMFSIPVYEDRGGRRYLGTKNGWAPKGVDPIRYKQMALVDFISKLPELNPGLLLQVLRVDEPGFGRNQKERDQWNLYYAGFQQFIFGESKIGTPSMSGTGLFFESTDNPKVLRVYGRSYNHADPESLLKSESNNGNYSIRNLTITTNHHYVKDGQTPTMEFVAEIQIP